MKEKFKSAAGYVASVTNICLPRKSLTEKSPLQSSIPFPDLNVVVMSEAMATIL